ncbi:uncharacterized protein BO88DRAFT_181165 [Aspergillus vadensis CBS 113365]|uniref:Uncharacterized protein n=1 Tax=Aspergillus vadensis (strain CBS 113365 / IMI 142717 / IBT 24658) TaxID=1448311 RepID=A0A319BEF2_ASPVC|nr:hypothetical protein BO88DRAFT_181165 [Aspergillus vadensis CBS 113365]PYH64313.1 hypothetical protein BO88DRAFT_181165 [Aspergillus vadensis CBS 113365]
MLCTCYYRRKNIFSQGKLLILSFYIQKLSIDILYNELTEIWDIVEHQSVVSVLPV